MGVSSWLVFCVRAAYAHGTVRQWTFTIRHTFDAVAKARTTSAAAARHCLNTVITRSPCDEAIHAVSAATGWIASLRSQRREEIATIRPKRIYSNPDCIPPRKLHACHHAIVVNRAGPSVDSQTSAEIRFASIIARCCLEV